MGHRADQPPSVPGQHPRVRVQRDHIGKARRPQRRAGRAFDLKGVLRPRRAQQQPVQVHQRAALAVPAHPHAVRLQQRPRAAQQRVLLPARPGVHRRQPRPGGVQYRPVPGQGRRVGVGEVAQQQKAHVYILLQAAQRLEPLADLRGPLRPGQQRGQRHQRSAVVRQRLQLQLQKPRRRNQPGKDPPRQRVGDAPAQHGTGGPQQRQACARRQRPARQRRQQRYRHHRPPPGGVRHKPRQPRARPAQLPGQRPAAPIVVQPPARAPADARLTTGGVHGAAGHGNLRQPEPAGDARQLPPHRRPGIVVHAGIGPGGVLPQLPFHPGEGVEGVLPVERVQHPPGGQQVLQPQRVPGALRLGASDRLLRGQPPTGKLRLQPRADPGQALLPGQLQRVFGEGERPVRPADAPPVGPAACGGAAFGAAGHRSRREQQRPGQRRAQRRGDRPQLRHGQRLGRVQRRHRADQPVPVQRRVAQGDQPLHRHLDPGPSVPGGQPRAALHRGTAGERPDHAGLGRQHRQRIVLHPLHPAQAADALQGARQPVGLPPAQARPRRAPRRVAPRQLPHQRSVPARVAAHVPSVTIQIEAHTILPGAAVTRSSSAPQYAIYP